MTSKVMAIYDEFFALLEGNQAYLAKPDPDYAWRYYKSRNGEGMTIERMRRGIQILDRYWLNQKNYVQDQTRQSYTRGPELDRLPDSALTALFQRLDNVLAESGPS